MAIPEGLTRDHVLSGINDLEAGSPHSFGPSTSYDLLHNGKRFPPKAVLGMAARHAVGDQLTPADFKGGESSKCFRILRKLGFMIVPKANDQATGPPQRAVAAWVFQANPDLYDLDQYFSRHTYIYWNCPRFADLVKLNMPVFFKRSGSGGGVVAKGLIAELPVRHDDVKKPEFLRDDLWKIPSPPTNLLHVGIELEEVRLNSETGMIPTRTLEAIPELSRHPLVAVRRGTIFRLSAEQAIGVFREWGGVASLDVDDVPYAAEGRRVLVTHRRIERCRELIEDKKNAFRREHGKLFCEVCRQNYSDKYGPLWSERAIEAHHLKPLAEISEACRTEFEDLILVCRNCHALIHQSPNVEENLQRLHRHFQSTNPD